MKTFTLLLTAAALHSTTFADFASWRTANFPADLTHLETSGELADPDGDGFTNLLEYVFDTNPLIRDPASIVGTGLNANRPTLTVRIRKPMTDAKLHVFGSADLRTWGSVNGVVEVSRIVGATFDTVTFAHPTVMTPSAVRYFLRPRAVLSTGTLLAPDNLSLALEGAGARLRWQDNSSSENYFTVQRRFDGGSWNDLITTAPDVTTALDAAPPTTGLVEYRVFNAGSRSNIVAMRPGDGDADGIPDSVELANALDPYDWRDAMADTDGDRVPNVWEHNAGTSITSAASKPAPTFVVDPANAANSPTDNIVATIQGAINATPANTTTLPFSIIEVKAGVYAENLTLSSDRRIALYGVGLPEVFAPNNLAASLRIYGESAVDGFRIRKGEFNASIRAVEISLPLAASNARVSNVIIHGHRALFGAAFLISNGRVAIAHCTAFDNGTGSASSLYVSNETSQVEVLNCIFWNKGYVTAELALNGGFARSTQSIFYGSGPAGALVRKPFLNAYGFLTAPSLARNLGNGGAKADGQNEPRDTTPDVGADEFIDSDGDGLPDWV